VIRQLYEVQLLGDRQLLLQRLGRNPNAHRRQFMPPLGNRVPYQDVAIQPMRFFAGLTVSIFARTSLAHAHKPRFLLAAESIVGH
jgi:hypothetical protein